MLTRLALAVLLVSTLACGSSSSPAAPSTPAPPPAPVYPNLIAGWSGTATITASSTSVSASNVCQSTWIISSQTNGDISGTFQLSGGTTVNCAQSSVLTGTVTTAGALSIAFTAQAPPAGCTVLSGTPLAGVVTGASMTLQQTVHLTCNGSAVDQNVTIALTKR